MCLNIEILADDVSEATEEFELTLTTDDGAVVEVNPGMAVVEITDDDGKLIVALFFSMNLMCLLFSHMLLPIVG